MLERVRNYYQLHPTRTILIGIGAVVLTPTLIPLLKPVAKATVKTGVTIYEKTKGAIAESGEALADVVAEAKAEVAQEKAQQAALKSTLVSDLNQVDS